MRWLRKVFDQILGMLGCETNGGERSRGNARQGQNQWPVEGLEHEWCPFLGKKVDILVEGKKVGIVLSIRGRLGM